MNKIRIKRRLVFMFLVILSSFVFLSPDHALALWAKRFDTGWNNFGGVIPQEAEYYIIFSSEDPSGTQKSSLFLSKLSALGDVQWTKKIFVGDYDSLYIGPLEDGGFFVQGTTRTTKDGPRNIVWAKLDSSFNQIFGKVFGGSRDESIGFTFTNDGGWIGTGVSNSYGSGENDDDMMIIKLNASGNIAWSKVFHHGLDDEAPIILEISDGYMLCSSVANNTSSGGKDILVSKLDSSGNPQWVKLYGGTGINRATIKKISDGNFLLYGTTKANPTTSNTDIILFKIDGSGNILWAKKYASSKAEIAHGITENPDGSFLLDGSVEGIGTFDSNILLMKLDSSGGIVWQKTLGGSGFDVAVLETTSDGNYLLTGQSTSFGSGPYDFDIIFAKLSSLDPINFIWQRRFGGTGDDLGGVFEIENKYILTGSTSSFGSNYSDIFAVVLDSNANYPGCYIENVNFTEGNPNLIASNLAWAPTSTSLTTRTAGAASDIALNVVNATITATDICTPGVIEGTLSVTPSEGLSSSGAQGGPFNPLSKTYTLQNTGGSSINWTASKGQAWTTLSATSGALTAGASTTVTVSINSNANSLSPGSYNDTVSFMNTTNGIGSTTRSVSLTVNALAPTIGYSPTNFSFSATQGGSNPANQSLSIWNAGGGTFTWTVSDNATWLSLSLTSGSGSGTVAVSVNISGLAAGTYNATITITASGATNSPVNIPVDLTVTACAVPSAPSLLSPSNGLTGVSTRPTLDWNDVSGATYDVQVCSDSGCSSVVWSSNVAVSQLKVWPALDPWTLYYWRARANNDCGSSAWTGVWSFTTGQPQPNPLNDTTEFVKQQYRDFLNREAEPAGLNYWVDLINRGERTRAQVIQSFFWSVEFGQRIAPLARLYFAYFLRVPDYDGLMFWINAYTSGGASPEALKDISDAFAGSAEFQQRYGALSNGEFVTLIYRNILGRDPDPEGYNFWVGKLNSQEMTRGQVMIGFSESYEYRQMMNSEVFVTMIYMGMLRRGPEQEGFEFWVNAMDMNVGNPEIELALINGFLNSAEYANRFQ